MKKDGIKIGPSAFPLRLNQLAFAKSVTPPMLGLMSCGSISAPNT